MLDRFEGFERLAAHSLCGGFGSDQLGELLFEVEKLMIKPVIGLVADRGLGQNIVGMIVFLDFFDQLRMASFGITKRHGATF